MWRTYTNNSALQQSKDGLPFAIERFQRAKPCALVVLEITAVLCFVAYFLTVVACVMTIFCLFGKNQGDPGIPGHCIYLKNIHWIKLLLNHESWIKWINWISVLNHESWIMNQGFVNHESVGPISWIKEAPKLNQGSICHFDNSDPLWVQWLSITSVTKHNLELVRTTHRDWQNPPWLAKRL